MQKVNQNICYMHIASIRTELHDEPTSDTNFRLGITCFKPSVKTDTGMKDLTEIEII